MEKISETRNTSFREIFEEIHFEIQRYKRLNEERWILTDETERLMRENIQLNDERLRILEEELLSKYDHTDKINEQFRNALFNLTRIRKLPDNISIKDDEDLGKILNSVLKLIIIKYLDKDSVQDRFTLLQRIQVLTREVSGI